MNREGFDYNYQNTSKSQNISNERSPEKVVLKRMKIIVKNYLESSYLQLGKHQSFGSLMVVFHSAVIVGYLAVPSLAKNKENIFIKCNSKKISKTHSKIRLTIFEIHPSAIVWMMRSVVRIICTNQWLVASVSHFGSNYGSCIRRMMDS